MEILHTAPASSSFIPLAQHEQETPESFYDGPAVLHYEDRAAVGVTRTASIRAISIPFFSRQSEGSEESEGDEEVVLGDVSVWVSSSRLQLYSISKSTGVSIPYTSILLHAIQRLLVPNSDTEEEQSGVYMQLSSDNAPDSSDSDDAGVVELTLVPSNQDTAQSFFEAISTCSDLHPDPTNNTDGTEDGEGIRFEGSVGYESGVVLPGDPSGGMPPPMPGSGGWITAENVNDFVDEDGNWRERDGAAAETLGPGAGVTRSRETNGDHAEEETKWQRTD